MLVPYRAMEVIQREREVLIAEVAKAMGRLGREVLTEMVCPAPPAEETAPTKMGPIFSEEQLQAMIKKILDTELKSLLHDVDYRIGVMFDVAERLGIGPQTEGRIGTRDLNLAHHLLDGFTFTDNSPTAGSVAWAGCHIVYKGTDYAITDGNTTKKYIWWDFDAVPNTAFQTSDTKPMLTDDDVLVAINDGGTHRLAMVPGKMAHGSMLLDGSINTAEIADNAISSDKLAALSVIESKIANGAVTSDKIQNDAVITSKIGDGQVTEPKIGAGAVATNKLNIASHLLY